MELVSIIITNWNGETVLKRCLDCVFSQTYKNIEVIVADDASTDRSVEIIKKYPKARLIAHQKRLGLGGNANSAFQAARGEFVATLDNDAFPEPEWLEKLVRAIQKYGKNTAVVEGEVTHGHGVGVLNGSLNLLSQNADDVFGADLTRKFYSGFCSSIIRRDVTDKMYDDDYFFFQAEPYLGWLLRLKGFDVRREPSSKALHLGSLWRKDRVTVKRYERLNEQCRVLNMLLFYETGTLLKVLPLDFLYAGMRFLKKLRKEPWKSLSIIQAHLWPLLHPRLVAQKRAVIQRQRKVTDDEITRMMSSRIFGRATKLNRLVAAYCRLVGLPTVETTTPKKE